MSQSKKEQDAISLAMGLLGSRTSKRKAASSAANGRLGGSKPTKFDAKSIARRAKYAAKRESKALPARRK